MELKGRTCVYAGATGAIGRGAVRALAQQGMNVVMVTHNPDSAKEIIAEMSGLPGTAAAVSNEKGDAAVFREVKERFGSADVVICTIGGLSAVKPISEITAEELNGKLQHQVTAPFLMVKEALPYLKESKAGRVILLSSAGAQDGFAGESMVDSIARAGVISMTYCMARELAKDGITVNCIARSGMINDHEPHRPGDYDARSIEQLIPVGRLGKAEEFGALVQYLASEESAFMTGQVLSLSGGLHIG